MILDCNFIYVFRLERKEVKEAKEERLEVESQRRLRRIGLLEQDFR